MLRKAIISIKDPIKTEGNGRYFYFTQKVTEEMLTLKTTIVFSIDILPNTFQQWRLVVNVKHQNTKKNATKMINRKK